MKAIRLFLKDHLSFIFFQIGLVLFLLLLFWLDGFRNYSTAIYSIIISVLLTIGYLSGKYTIRRFFYKSIVRKPTKMEDALLRHTQGPEHIRTAAYTRALYKIYQHEVQTLYSSQSRQLEFMNHWVHQMKTPISVINLLLEEVEIDRESIKEEIERLHFGLDSVLVNARLETFERDMAIERVNLKQLVQEVVTEHKRLLITNGVFPVVTIDESFVVVTDRKWVKIVLGQFITNSIKYTFEKNKKIFISAARTENKIAFTVRDEGVGIPTSDLNRVTQAFFTGENGRLTGESTGMGLYIAAEVCEKLGHPLKIESELGKGTTVSLIFENTEVVEGFSSETNRDIAGNNEDL